jgi:hypothetical protein
MTTWKTRSALYYRQMKILPGLGRWWGAFRVTHGLFNALESIFKPFSGTRLEEKVWRDEFVIAYLYGVMARFFDVYGTVGQLPSGQILWKCYERVFPGRGQEIVELTIARIKGKDEVFMRDLRVGSRETREYLASKRKSGFPSLTAYLTIRSS